MFKIKVFNYNAPGGAIEKEVNDFINSIDIAENGLNFTDTGLLFIAGTDKGAGLTNEKHIQGVKSQMASHYARKVQATINLEAAKFKNQLAAKKPEDAEGLQKAVEFLANCEQDLLISNKAIESDKQIIKDLESGKLAL